MCEENALFGKYISHAHVLKNINKTSRKAGIGGWLSRKILRFCLSRLEVVGKCGAIQKVYFLEKT